MRFMEIVRGSGSAEVERSARRAWPIEGPRSGTWEGMFGPAYGCLRLRSEKENLTPYSPPLRIGRITGAEQRPIGPGEVLHEGRLRHWLLPVSRQSSPAHVAFFSARCI